MIYKKIVSKWEPSVLSIHIHITKSPAIKCAQIKKEAFSSRNVATLPIDEHCALEHLFGDIKGTITRDGTAETREIDTVDSTEKINRLIHFFSDNNGVIFYGKSVLKSPAYKQVEPLINGEGYIDYMGQKIGITLPKGFEFHIVNEEEVYVEDSDSTCVKRDTTDCFSQMKNAVHAEQLNIADPEMVLWSEKYLAAVKLLSTYTSYKQDTYFSSAYIRKVIRQVKIEQGWDKATSPSITHLEKALLSLCTKSLRASKKDAEKYEDLKAAIYEAFTETTYEQPSQVEKDILDLLMEALHSSAEKIPARKDGYSQRIKRAIKDSIIRQLGQKDTIDTQETSPIITLIREELFDSKDAGPSEDLIRKISDYNACKEQYGTKDVEAARRFRKEWRLEKKLASHRILTLLGPTGSGKTRAAVQMSLKEDRECFQASLGESEGYETLVGRSVFEKTDETELKESGGHRETVVFQGGVITQFAKAESKRALILDEVTMMQSFPYLRSVIEEGVLWVNGERIVLKGDWVIILTGNVPDKGKYIGRYDIEEYLYRHSAVMSKPGLTMGQIVHEVIAPYLESNSNLDAEEQGVLLKRLAELYILLRDKLDCEDEVFGVRDIKSILATIEMIQSDAVKKGRPKYDVLGLTDWVVLHFVSENDLGVATQLSRVCQKTMLSEDLPLLILESIQQGIATGQAGQKKAIVVRKEIYERWRSRDTQSEKTENVYKITTNAAGQVDYTALKESIDVAYESEKCLVIDGAAAIQSHLWETVLNDKLTNERPGFGIIFLIEDKLPEVSPALRSRMTYITDTVACFYPKEVTPVDKEIPGHSKSAAVASYIKSEAQVQHKRLTIDIDVRDIGCYKEETYYKDKKNDYNRREVNTRVFGDIPELERSLYKLQGGPEKSASKKDCNTEAIPLHFDDEGYAKIVTISPSQTINSYYIKGRANLEFFKDINTDEIYAYLDPKEINKPKKIYLDEQSDCYIYSPAVNNIITPVTDCSLIAQFCSYTDTKKAQILNDLHALNIIPDLLEIDPSDDKVETIKKIFSYLQTFNEGMGQIGVPETVLKQTTEPALQSLYSLILRRRGVCRHVSSIAKLLFDLMGIPARIVRSKRHQFVEVCTLFHSRKFWFVFDVNYGGCSEDPRLLAREYLVPPKRVETNLEEILVSAGINLSDLEIQHLHAKQTNSGRRLNPSFFVKKDQGYDSDNPYQEKVVDSTKKVIVLEEAEQIVVDLFLSLGYVVRSSGCNASFPEDRYFLIDERASRRISELIKTQGIEFEREAMKDERVVEIEDLLEGFRVDGNNIRSKFMNLYKMYGEGLLEIEGVEYVLIRTSDDSLMTWFINQHEWRVARRLESKEFDSIRIMSFPLLKWAYERGLDMRRICRNKTTFLFNCKNIKEAKFLVETCGVDPSQESAARENALFSINNVEMAKYLVEECGVTASLSNRYGLTPLMFSRSLEIAKYFIESCGQRVAKDLDQKLLRVGWGRARTEREKIKEYILQYGVE